MPYIVANELICNLLARAILLPTPPGFIVDNEGVPYFTSLDFNLSGDALPPIVPSQVVAAKPNLAAAVVLFDVWIYNTDRHPNNLHFDTKTKDLEVFDHSHALLSDGEIDFLRDRKDTLGFDYHCLSEDILDINPMKEWANRIREIPEFYIREVINSAVRVGFPEEFTEECAEMLIARRENLLQLIVDNQAFFPKVDVDLLFQQGQTDG